jgi:hypothetical protein
MKLRTRLLVVVAAIVVALIVWANLANTALHKDVRADKIRVEKSQRRLIFCSERAKFLRSIMSLSEAPRLVPKSVRETVALPKVYIN